MLCKDIIETIKKRYPEQQALEWDNVGLLCGRDDKEVARIYIALDATDEVIREAVLWEADMLITHHPLIFSGMKKINNQDFIGRRLLALAGHDISYYAMHTNYDVCGMAELSGQMLGLAQAEVLEVTCDAKTPAGIGRVADLEKEVTLSECCHRVKESFQLEHVKVFGDLDTKVGRVAVSPGAGKSMIGIALEKQADVLITGDIDHHTGIDAVAQGLAIIDAGHYGLEHIFIADMKAYLEASLEGICVKTAAVNSPFVIV